MGVFVPEVLLESKSARNRLLGNVNQSLALSTLNKAKSLFMAVWQVPGVATTDQMAEYYEITVETVRQVCQRHREELETDGLKVLRGEELKIASDIRGASSNRPENRVKRGSCDSGRILHTRSLRTLNIPSPGSSILHEECNRSQRPQEM